MANAALIVLYLLAMLVIGTLSFGRSRSVSGFYVGSRAGGTWLITGSLLASIVGGSSTLGIAGLGYSLGMVGAWWMLVAAAGLAIMSVWLSEKIRSYGVYTLPEILTAQYGSMPAGIVSSLLIIVAWIGVIAAQIIASGKILTLLLPWDLTATMAGVTAVMVLYTALGGQGSILRTDLVQALIILAGILVCAAAAVAATGGPAAMAAALPPGHLSFPVSPSFGLADLLTFCLFVGSVFVVGPDIYSRLLCARTPQIARRASLLAACAMAPFAFAIAFIGVSARLLLPDIPAESAFPALVLHLLPAGLDALVIAALLAAVMSSADTCLLTTGAILVNDIVRPLTRTGIPDRTLILLSRAAVVVIGLASLVIAWRVQGVIGSLLLAYTIYSGGLVVPVLFGFFSGKFGLNSPGAVFAIVSGGATAAWLKLAGYDNLLALSFPVSAAFLFAGSIAARRHGSQSRTVPAESGATGREAAERASGTGTHPGIDS
jgi:SSS family solute:Na+ symporter